MVLADYYTFPLAQTTGALVSLETKIVNWLRDWNNISVCIQLLLASNFELQSVILVES